MKIFAAAFLIILTTGISFSQIVRDSARVNFSDSISNPVFKSIDTSKQISSDIDSPIEYSASDSIVYDFNSNKVYLYNNAKLAYKDLKLESGRIVVDRESQALEAYGIPDTVRAGKFIQMPLMFQGNDKYEGSRLTYNFKTQQGSVSMGFSEAEVGYYYGDKIKKVTNDVLFIKNGIYTTSSDREDPEYYFLSPKMKVIPNDKVIAQSVFLYIEGVPVFWIPFGIFPNRSGRSSGIIVPTIGDDATYGKYVSRVGYFWAMNDYTDLALTGSFFTKGRTDLYGRFRYALKYNFSGSVDGGYSRIRLGESSDIGSRNSDEWGLNVVHNQQINPTTRLDASLAFVSNKNYYNVTTNSLSELLLQNVLSNLTLSKVWENKPYSLNLNYYRDQNLQTGDITERIPFVNFSISQTFPFESEYSGTFNKKFYEYFSYSYNGSFLSNRIRATTKNSLNQDSAYRDWRTGMQNLLNFQFAPKFEYITFAPYFNYAEIWYNKYVTKFFDPMDSSVVTSDANAVKALRYFNAGARLSTRFVGIFNPKIFNVTGIRHTLTPQLTYIYSPDFSDPKWGYYRSYTNASGQQIKYSIFEKEVFGSAPVGESQSLAFTLGNIFEMKTRVNDSTENKFQLLVFDAGINYNFAADSLKFSELLTSFRTNIGNLLNISGGASFNLYKFDPVSNQRMNKFLLNTDSKLADMTNFSLSMSTSFDFGFSKKNAKPVAIEDTMSVNKGDYRDTRKIREDEVSFNIPFSGSLGYNFTQTSTNPSVKFRTSNLSGSVAFNLTEKWRFTFSSSYDLVHKQIAAPYITAYRDLNSWEMNFNWYPSGVYRGFSLEIRIKAPQLRDIKVTKQTNSRGVY